MQLLRRPGFQDGETCQGESVSASLTDLASQEPANFPQADPIFSVKPMASVAAGNAPAGTWGRRDDASEPDFPILPIISRWPVSMAQR
jgi:hypothetical protein